MFRQPNFRLINPGERGFVARDDHDHNHRDVPQTPGPTNQPQSTSTLPPTDRYIDTEPTRTPNFLPAFAICRFAICRHQCSTPKSLSRPVSVCLRTSCAHRNHNAQARPRRVGNHHSTTTPHRCPSHTYSRVQSTVSALTTTRNSALISGFAHVRLVGMIVS